MLNESKVSNLALESMKSFHPSIVSEVEQAVQAHEWVIVGMGQNPLVGKARRLLSEKNISHHYLGYGSYFSKWKQRLAIKLWSGWPTFPQVFHKGVLVGGASDLEKYLNKVNN